MSNSSPLSLTSKTQTAKSPLQLLVLSNGHGEDAIAVRILHELEQQPNPPEIFALPLVGEGHAYQQLKIPLIGSVRTMPSGGFIYMDGRQLMRDVSGGLLQLTLNQIRTIRRWSRIQEKLDNNRAILAVGDIVPLLFAWLSKANYAFVGTAKSEYYVQDENGILKRKAKGAYWENFSGSVYHPWERWLMNRRFCKAVFPRDSLTTKILKDLSIPAFDVGNPMMDGLEPSFGHRKFYNVNVEQEELVRPLIVTLLPGSRPKEAYANWEKIMVAVSAVMALFRERDFVAHASGSVIFLGAIAPSLDCDVLRQSIQAQGWRVHPESPIPIAEALTFKQKNAYIILTQKAYNDCLHLGDLAIAMAGTATEQFVGLGKPAVTIPGDGPQFNPAFAEAQSRLLGKSVILIEQPYEIADIVRKLLIDPDELHLIANNGVQRMGKPGAARRIAECLMEKLG